MNSNRKIIDSLESANQLLEQVNLKKFYINQYKDVFCLYEKNCNTCNFCGRELHKLHAVTKDIVEIFKYFNRQDIHGRIYERDVFDDVDAVPEMRGSWNTGEGFGTHSYIMISSVLTFMEWCEWIGFPEELIDVTQVLGDVFDIRINGMLHILFENEIYMVPDTLQDKDGYGIPYNKRHSIELYGLALKEIMQHTDDLFIEPIFYNDAAWEICSMYKSTVNRLNIEKEALEKELNDSTKELKRVRKRVKSLLDSMNRQNNQNKHIESDIT